MENLIIRSIVIGLFLHIGSRTKLGPVRSMKLLFLIAMIPLLIKNIQKYGFWSPDNLAMFIVLLVFAILYKIVVVMMRKFNRWLGYVHSEKKTFTSPNSKHIVVLQRNFWGTPFLYLNEKLILEGDKVIDGGVIITDVGVNWKKDNTCKIILSTKNNPCYMELDYMLNAEKEDIE